MVLMHMQHDKAIFVSCLPMSLVGEDRHQYCCCPLAQQTILCRLENLQPKKWHRREPAGSGPKARSWELSINGWLLLRCDLFWHDRPSGITECGLLYAWVNGCWLPDTFM